MDIKRQEGKSKSNRFVINIRYRENATWQGDVLWVNQNRQCNFRSALELLKLIDGAMDSSGFPEEDRYPEKLD